MDEIIIRGIVCAIHSGRIDTVKAALRSCNNHCPYSRFPLISNSSVSKFHQCCLYVASESNCKSLVEFSLSSGTIVDINAKFQGNMNALHIATENGHEDVVELLLRFVADPNSRTASGDHPLYIAAGKGFEKIVRLLLKFGADPNMRTASGDLPLCIAAGKGFEKIVKLLLGYGADADAKYHENAVCKAANYGHERVVQFLLEFGALEDLDVALCLAAECEHANCAKVLLDFGVDPNSELSDVNALVRAIDSGSKSVIELLLDYGADVNVVNGAEVFFTPLDVACLHGDIAIVKFLLDNGARINHNLRNPLGLAAQKGYMEIVQLLLNRGSKVDFRDPTSGETALLEAAESGHRDIVQLLLENGADFNAVDNAGRSLLNNAVDNGHWTLAGALVMRMVRMRGESLVVSHKNWNACRGNWVLWDFQTRCMREMHDMKSRTFLGSFVTPFDVLRTKNVVKLSAFARNTSIQQELESGELVDTLPVFGPTIAYHYQIGVRRNVLFDRVRDILNLVSDESCRRIPRLPLPCVSLIFNYLDVADVRNLEQ